MKPALTHIIVAAGTGSRYGASLPKQFCALGGRPVVMTAIDRLRDYGCGGRILLVLSQQMMPLWHDLCREHAFESPETVVGGSTRWHSVKNALALLDPKEKGVVTVHDAARPLVPSGLIDCLCQAIADGAQGAIPVVPVADSLRLIADGQSKAVDRSLYRAVQTPQAFPAQLLHQAYAMDWRPEFTDDASVMEAAGFTQMALVDGAPCLLKITNPGDIAVAELLMTR